ncbi:hypothetical protein ASG76_13335 [Nocardioides sp. Soil774]|uniref:hypothetical protein n=1 Tax=Nocardioides sp. Soil774 TaxID=1736408 RepID=UPI0006FA51B6|nr:hypothetical protein [Nocardioides sp. Soil774]KRE93440.1 hypothetical protein ASG76_13335 [Nocardioides sp. Soil774]
MYEQNLNDHVNVDVNADVRVDANSNAVMVLGVCFVACIGFLTLGTVRIAGQADGTNKLRALVPWGRKPKETKHELPLEPPTEAE